MDITEQEKKTFEQLGNYIQKLRIEKNLSQDELAIKSEISRSQLAKIEKGKVYSYGYTVERVLNALGTSQMELILERDYGALARFNNEFGEIWEFLSEDNSEDFSLKVERLKQSNYYDKTKPHFKRVLLLCDAIILRRKGHYLESLKVANEALEVSTSFEVIMSNGKKTPITLVEYKILISMSNSKSKLDLQDESIEILEMCRRSLNADVVPLETARVILPVVYLNFSNILRDERKYAEALNIAKEGIGWCKRSNVFKNFGEIMYNLGTAHLYLGNKNEGVESVKQAYNSFRSIDKHKEAEMVVKFVVDKFGVEMYRHFSL